MNKLILIFFYMVFFILCDEYEDDVDTCSKKGNKNDCINAKLKSPSRQCCFTGYNDEKVCNILDNDKTFMYFYRGFYRQYEELGNEYIHTNQDQYFCEKRNEMITTCKNKEYYYRADECTFTLEEKKIFESDKHCLNLYYNSLQEGKFNSINKNDCHNALLLESSKELGITCGFYDYTVVFKNSTILHFKTCYFITPDEEFEKLKAEGYEIEKDWLDKKNLLYTLLMRVDIDPDNDIKSFTADISDSNRVYSQSIDSEKNFSKMISFSKYLILFLIIVLLL